MRFPALREGRSYRVAISDYAFRNYRDLSYSDGAVTDERVADALLEELEDTDAQHPLMPDNRPRQRVVRAATERL